MITITAIRMGIENPPAKLTRRVFLLSGIGVKRVSEKDGCATTNQKRNNEGHECFSCEKKVRYLLRE